MMKRKGSALLIVLGMLAFMVVSAVSFAMFMRQSRVPSSYLRRTASSRYLLKAALANAIARIDGQLATCRQIGNDNLGDSATSGYCEGVYDDPYPGVGPKENNNNNDISAVEKDGDHWEKRVFCPFGLLGPVEDGNGVSHYRTVATLTLEALAYLPPAIINEVRLYSRLTRTAMWRNLAFDAGRYAFCAVDVSDCFDINRLSAGMRRSSAPGERVNLSSLFPDNGSSLDTILKQCSNYWTPGGGNIPFTSVADFNIVAQNTPFAPFGQMVVNHKSLEECIRSHSDSVANALFITDTWFPPTNTVESAFDLSKDQGQPFLNFNAKCVFNIDDEPTELCKVLLKNLGYPGLACLYDYLDSNQEPISLALPTVEAVPMICGLGVDIQDGFPGIKFKAVELPEISYTIKDGNNEHKRHRKITRYTLDNIPDLSISGVVTFPFKHMMGSRAPKNYQVEVLTAVFFAENDLRARVTRSVLNPGSWNQSMGQMDANGVFWQKALANAPQFSNVKTTEGAVQQFAADMRYSSVAPAYIFHKITDTEDPPPTDENGQPKFAKLPEFTDEITTDGTGANNPFHVLDKNGNVPNWWTSAYKKSGDKLLEKAEELSARDPQSLGQNQQTFASAEDYRPYVAVWARVVVGGKTVDLAPATIDDDEALLPGCKYELREEFQKFSGTESPLLDFKVDKSFKYTFGGFDDVEKKNEDDFKLVDWDTLYAFDPRYNFAPEDWFGIQHANGGDASPLEWRQKIGADGNTGNQLLGVDGRDPDIFMFTSDQEHLQSIGELAFLPWTQDMTGNVQDPFSGNFAGSGRYHGENNFHMRGSDLIRALNGVPNDTTRQFANYRFMWRTYTPVDHGDGWDPIYELTDGGKLCNIVSGTGDFRVNPFSPDTRVLMAALKDTPADWFFASDDKTLNPTYEMTAANRVSWAFCKNSSIGAELNDEEDDPNYELGDIADAMCSRFSQWARRTTPDRNDWEKAFDGNVDLDYMSSDNLPRKFLWYDGQRGDKQKSIFGIEENFRYPLHGVDRKFLYSFWRECFQNRQQLFLVFLRAEPLTVGGMGEGSLASAQLGARGVALVWRDPQPPARGSRQPRGNMTSPERWKQLFDESGPHRTRVLFYHQFD